jgi:phage shock protein A
MSTGMTPYISVPQGFTPKSFWQRPEGGAGKGLIYTGIAAACVATFWFWGLIVPFVVETLQNTVLSVAYFAILLAAGSIALGVGPLGGLRSVISNAFQSFSRMVARCYTTIDPIGILNNNLDDMRKEKATLDGTVQRFAGSESMLQRNIASKQAEAQKAYAMSQQAARMAAAETDPMKKQQLTLQSGTDEENAGMLLQGVQQLKALEADTSHLLTTFQQWSMVSDAKIQRTANKVSFLTTQRKMILDAKATLSIGQRLLKGNSQQEQMVDMALDYLEEDTSRTLGEIRDFSRFTDKLLTNDQIESGANAELARQQFAEFSAKLLTSGSAPAGADLIQIPGISSPAPVPMARPAGGFSSTSDDIDPFK